jgi:hypothetical protein
MTTVVSTGGGGGGGGGATTVTDLKSSAEEQQALNRSRRVDAARAQCYNVGAAQLAIGLLGMTMSFSWLSTILTVANGGLALGAWSSLPEAMRFFDENKRGCCDPQHTKGLAIATIVFAVLELISLGATTPIGLFLIVIANADYTTETGSSYAVPLAPRAAITWIGLAIVAGTVFALLNLILAIIQMCAHDSLMNAGLSGRVLTTSASTVTVIMPGGGGGGGAAGYPMNPYAVGGYHPQPGQHQGGGYPMQPGQGYPMQPGQGGYPMHPGQGYPVSPTSMYVSPHQAAYQPHPGQYHPQPQQYQQPQYAAAPPPQGGGEGGGPQQPQYQTAGGAPPGVVPISSAPASASAGGDPTAQMPTTSVMNPYQAATGGAPKEPS